MAVPLLAPARHPKRVTLAYEPHPAEAAAFRQAVRRQQQRAETATDLADRARARARAEQAAHEEAQGAGLGLYSMAVTTTVTDPEALPRAVADV